MPMQQRARALERMRYLIQAHGMPVHVAAGIVGNAWHESGGLNPRAVGDRGDSIGEFQFNRRGEQPAFRAFAGARGAATDDWRTQYDFVASRMKGPYSGVYARMAGGDHNAASDEFSRGYERPLASAAYNDRRRNWAATALNLYRQSQGEAPVAFPALPPQSPASGGGMNPPPVDPGGEINAFLARQAAMMSAAAAPAPMDSLDLAPLQAAVSAEATQMRPEQRSRARVALSGALSGMKRMGKM